MSNDLTPPPTAALTAPQFPIMEGICRRAADDLTSIPWAMIAPHEAMAHKNHGGQTLAGLARRGGLDPLEAVAVLQDMDYRQCWPYEGPSRAEFEKRTREARCLLKAMLAQWSAQHCPVAPPPAADKDYNSWWIVLEARREPIVKRCTSVENEMEMRRELRRLYPTATLIHTILNPGDHRQLWATSEAHRRAELQDADDR